MKPYGVDRDGVMLAAAAFGRLCVETFIHALPLKQRLQPPSGGCVLKQRHAETDAARLGSRLRAAVC